MVRSVPETLPFGIGEYEGRHVALRAAMSAAGVDALVVTAPANLCYLTGYVASWYAPRLPIGVIVHRSASELVLVDWTRHADYVPLTAIHDEVELVDYGTAPAELVSALRRRGWHEGTVGLERFAPNPAGGIVQAVSEGLRLLGTEVVDGDYLVDDLRLYKSEAEMAKVNEAAHLLDESFLALQEELRPGMTELQVAARITALLADRGSEVAAQHALVSSGPTAWADVHAFPSRREIQRGEVVSVDASAVIDRYHVNLCRSFSIGTDNPTADGYLKAGEASLAELCRTARVGESPRPAMAAAESSLRSRVPDENIWWVGGYALGISFPPSWVGHTYLADDGPRPVRLEVGYVSNYETIMFDRREQFESAAIDTVVVSEAGLAPLSKIPRGLLPAG